MTYRALVRMCILLAKFGIQQKLLKEKTVAFSRFQRLFARSSVYIIFVVSLLVFFACILVSTFLRNNFYSSTYQNYYECLDELGTNSYGLDAVYMIAFAVLAIVLYVSKVRENLGLSTEIKLTGVIAAIFGGITISVLFAIEDQGYLLFKIMLMN